MPDEKKPEKKPAVPLDPSRPSLVRPVLGVVVGLVPFAWTYRFERSSTVTEGEIRTITKRTAFDYVAVPCGVIALVLGLYGIVKGTRARHFVLALIGLVGAGLGTFQVAKGFFL